MSLTRHLASPRDPVRLWIDTRFPDIAALVADSRRSLRDAPTLVPTEGRPPSTTGMAIDYRIRYAFAVTPSAEMFAYAGAEYALSFLLLEIDPDHSALWRAVGDAGTAVQRPVDPLAPGLPANPVSQFFERVDHRVQALDPVGRALDEAADQELARVCFTLALFEEVGRTGTIAPGSLLDSMGPGSTADELLASIPDVWIEDLAALGRLSIETFGDRLARPAVLNPVFTQSSAVGGADADLISDGTLLEIKTTINPRIDGAWIRQLLGYLLLDTDDEFSVSSIGLYLSRQGRLLEWPLPGALDILAGRTGSNLAALRSDFAGFLANGSV